MVFGGLKELMTFLSVIFFLVVIVAEDFLITFGEELKMSFLPAWDEKKPSIGIPVYTVVW